mmetsp:Transcript_6502/g.14055  ORF Transcript_6502/g.14055 Transcript_6502/m.14055 type:complete len:119 (+) Transcript_6502:1100-1456(+)
MTTSLLLKLKYFPWETTTKKIKHSYKKQIITSANSEEDWTIQTFDQFPACIKTAIEEEKKVFIKAKYELQQQICAFKTEKQFIETFVKGKFEDVIQFDVRGKCIQVKRSTLGQFKNLY